MKLIDELEADSILGRHEVWLLNNGFKVTVIFGRIPDGTCALDIRKDNTYTFSINEYLTQKFSLNYEITSCIDGGLIEIPLQDLKKVLLIIEQLDSEKLESDQLKAIRHILIQKLQNLMTLRSAVGWVKPTF